jgi:hypothetical protein
MDALALRRMNQLGYFAQTGPLFDPSAIASTTPTTHIDFSHYFDSVASLVSQFLGSRGRYQTTQLDPYGNPVSTPAAQVAAAYQQPALNQSAEQRALQQQGTLGAGVGSGINGILAWATANPVLVFLGIGGIYLLFREPPRSRR